MGCVKSVEFRSKKVLIYLLTTYSGYGGVREYIVTFLYKTFCTPKFSRFDTFHDKHTKGDEMHWVRRYIPGLCHHKNTRCSHANKILEGNWRSIICIDCGRFLKGDLPYICYFTKLPHGRVINEES